MNFVGSGTPLNEQDITDAAHEIGCNPAAVRAVLEVETAGIGFWPDRRPKILFEPVVFYRQLGPGSARNIAVRQGLAAPHSGIIPYPPSNSQTRYAQLDQAMNIDITKALRSASWGLSQIVGFNYAACGYDGVIDMIDDFLTGERAQLLAMARLLVSWNIAEDLKTQQWDEFAKRYNGPAYLTNNYALKLRQAFAHYNSLPPAAMVQGQTPNPPSGNPQQPRPV